MTEEYSIEDRIKSVLPHLKDGYFSIDGLNIRVSKKENIFYVSRLSEYASDTKPAVLQQMEWLKAKFEGLLVLSPELKEYVKGFDIEYHLDLQAGQSFIKLCSERNGVMQWGYHFLSEEEQMHHSENVKLVHQSQERKKVVRKVMNYTIVISCIVIVSYIAYKLLSL